MAFKTILLHLHDTARASRLLETVVALARSMDAHLIALVVLPPHVVIPAMDGVEALFFRKYPSVAQFAADDRSNLALYRVVPKVVSVLDYSKGFGHTDYVTLRT
jgi:hypothetical protein